MSDDLRYSPHFIKATAPTADLLTDIEAYEQIGCHFGVAATAFVRATLRNPRVGEFEVRDVPFQAPGFRDRLLILSHVAKPSEADTNVPTLRPFGELLVEHSLTEARLVSPNSWTAWVEVRRERGPWRKLKPSEKAPAQPSPTEHIDAAIPVPEVT